MHLDKHGTGTACMGTEPYFLEPKSCRIQSTCMSCDAFIQFIERIFMMPRLGRPIIYVAYSSSACRWGGRLSRIAAQG